VEPINWLSLSQCRRPSVGEINAVEAGAGGWGLKPVELGTLLPPTASWRARAVPASIETATQQPMAREKSLRFIFLPFVRC